MSDKNINWNYLSKRSDFLLKSILELEEPAWNHDKPEWDWEYYNKVKKKIDKLEAEFNWCSNVMRGILKKDGTSFEYLSSFYTSYSREKLLEKFGRY